MNKEPKILLIDDNEIDNLINQRLIKELKLSANVQVFQSAKEALFYLKSTAQSNYLALPDLIFLDLYMPLMDGFSFMQEYKKLKLNQYKPIKILALSCSIYDKEIRNILSYEEVEDFISKPLNQEKINRLKNPVFK